MKIGLFALAGALTSALMAASPTPSFASQPALVVATSEQKVTFIVENMSCALCPVTVMAAMRRVPGVKSVDVDFKAKTATVVFDPSVTTADAIAAASTNAGYPARPASN